MARILVVEDSASARGYLRAALESSEPGSPALEVVEAASGFEAMRLLPRGPWDLVITDINMPDINGLELLSFLRSSEHHRATPVLLISTLSSERDVRRGLELGASAYLAKPFTQQALRAEVERLLGSGASRAGAHG